MSTVSSVRRSVPSSVQKIIQKAVQRSRPPASNILGGEPILFQTPAAAVSWQQFVDAAQRAIKPEDAQTAFGFNEQDSKDFCLAVEFFRSIADFQSPQGSRPLFFNKDREAEEHPECLKLAEDVLSDLQKFIQNNNDLYFKIQNYSYQKGMQAQVRKQVLPFVLSLCLLGALFLCGWQIGLLPALAALICKFGMFASFGIAGALVLANPDLVMPFSWWRLSAELKQFEQKQAHAFLENLGTSALGLGQLQEFKEHILAEYVSKNPDTSDEVRFLIAQNFGILAEILKNGHDDASSGKRIQP